MTSNAGRRVPGTVGGPSAFLGETTTAGVGPQQLEREETAASGEGTCVAVKPDEARWGFRGEVIKHSQQKRPCRVSLKFTQATDDLLGEHGIDLNDRPYLADTVKCMHTGQRRSWCERGCVL